MCKPAWECKRDSAGYGHPEPILFAPLHGKGANNSGHWVKEATERLSLTQSHENDPLHLGARLSSTALGWMGDSQATGCPPSGAGGCRAARLSSAGVTRVQLGGCCALRAAYPRGDTGFGARGRRQPCLSITSRGRASRKGRAGRSQKAFQHSERGILQKHPELGERVLFGCRTGSQARSPLAVVLGPSPLPGALGQAGVP